VLLFGVIGLGRGVTLVEGTQNPLPTPYLRRHIDVDEAVPGRRIVLNVRPLLYI
jgi:hypothetical protein